MPRHVLRPESIGVESELRPSTLWWSSPHALENRENRASKANKRRPFVIAAPALDIANGLRLEHAVDLILQDAVARYRMQQGWSVAFSPWFDQAGLLTQYVADLDLQERNGERTSRSDFDHLSRKWQRHRRHQMRVTLRKLGVAEREGGFHAATGQASALGAQLFTELFQRGRVVHQQVLVNHCHACGRHVSDDDLRVEHVKTTARVFRASVSGFGEVELSTLHPELLLSAVAVAAAPDDLNGLAMVGAGAELTLPVTGRRVPIVELASRQGAFSRTLSLVAPGFNAADFADAPSHDWPITQLFAPDGTVNDGFDGFTGLSLEECRARILELGRSEGSLSGRFSHVTARGIHTACGTEVRPRVAKVWLVRGSELGVAADQLMVESSSKFNHPAWQYSYRCKLSASTRPPAADDGWWEGAPAVNFHGFGNATDEVISERSDVGPRVPAVHCRACQRVIVAVDLPVTCGDCGSALEAESDVLRPGFGSALWTIAMAAQRSRPVQVDCAVLGRGLLESWIPTAELVAQALYGDTAIKHMVVHGAVRGRHGMATSDDNGLELALKRWDGDAIRAAVFTAMADHEGAQEVALDAGALDQGAHIVQSIRKGLAAVDVGDVNDIQYGAQLVRVEREVGRAMESYHLGWAYRLITSFITKRLHPATRLSPRRYETLLALLRPFHPELANQAARALPT